MYKNTVQKVYLYNWVFCLSYIYLCFCICFILNPTSGRFCNYRLGRLGCSFSPALNRFISFMLQKIATFSSSVLFGSLWLLKLRWFSWYREEKVISCSALQTAIHFRKITLCLLTGDPAACHVRPCGVCCWVQLYSRDQCPKDGAQKCCDPWRWQGLC